MLQSSSCSSGAMLKQLIILGCLAAAVCSSLAYVAKARSCDLQVASGENDDADSARNSFILLGATGDLSKREIYPTLWLLYRDNLLPNDTKIFGYARSRRTIEDLRKSVEPYVKVESHEEKRYDEFWSLNVYLASTGREDADYEKINQTVTEFEKCGKGNRLYYLALPPAVFPNATSQIKRVGMAKSGWTRVVIEKPFGRDTESADELSRHLAKLFTEDQIYRVDHFLNYEMAQNIFTLRFANRIFAPAWNAKSIASIEVDLNENLGVEGRGSFFDPNSIIRDVMQNHLLQIMTLIAMERPQSNDADGMRDAKVQLLKATREIATTDVVLGQYVANPDSDDPRERIGYRDDPTVPDDSISSTFALMVLNVDNERWRGVPFILRAGKGLDVNETRVVVQFKELDEQFFDSQPKRNQLIFIIKGEEGLQASLTSKVPGFSNDIEQVNLDFKYSEANKGVAIPTAYQRSILDVFQGSQIHFVRNDEVTEAWRIFTPMLHEIEGKHIRPIEYKFGSTGPIEAYQMEKKFNFLRQ